MLNKKFNLILAALLVASSITGCSNMKNPMNPPENPPVTTEKPVENPIAITDSVNTLLENNAVPKEFIDFANQHIATATPEEANLMVQSIFNSQKNYLQQLITDEAFVKANANAQFQEIYNLDITPDLAEKITDESIKVLVKDTYTNGFKLMKSEGQVYPIIDIKLYEDQWLGHLADSDRTTLEKDITTFNDSL